MTDQVEEQPQPMTLDAARVFVADEVLGMLKGVVARMNKMHDETVGTDPADEMARADVKTIARAALELGVQINSAKKRLERPRILRPERGRMKLVRPQ